MNNALFTAMTFAFLLAHIAALMAAFVLKRGAKAILVVNLAVASILLVFAASHPRMFDDPVDWQFLGLAAFELFAAAIAIAALRRIRLTVALSWIVFGVHFLASAGAVFFALTFRMTRLI